MTRSRFSALIAVVTAVAACAAPVHAQHEHGADSKGGSHAHAAVAKPKTFGEAARRIADTLARIKTALDGSSLAGVADDANAVAELSKQLGALALADTTVPRERVKDANLAGKNLAEAANALHESADAGDLPASKTQFAKVSTLVAQLGGMSPSTYFCPMHCEGSKTYDKPGECPVCHMKLKKQTSEQFSVDVQPAKGTIEAGKPVDLLFTLRDPRGAPVKDLETVHERPLHLLMVSKDLSWYAHEHPKLQPDGTFTLSWVFPAGGEYTLFHDFTPKNVGMQVVPVKLKVEGAFAQQVALKPDTDQPKLVDGYTVTLNTGGPIKTGGETHLAYTITKNGAPVTNLAPYLGAMGHLVIIGEDLKEFVHSHPHEGGEHAASAIANSKCPITDLDVDPKVPTGTWKDRVIGFCCPNCEKKWDALTAAERDAFVDALPKAPAGKPGGPRVDFEAHFRSPGVYKAWAQFNTGTTGQERVLTIPFTFAVQPGTNSGAPEHDAKQHGAAEHEGMPEGASLSEARKLYLTPGGAYTAADIAANGSTTASERYEGQMAKHDTKPKSGDLLCPITMTKANPRFSWVINGQTYLFCCPPCIDEFVQLAKEHPEELKAPEDYKKK